MYINPQKMVSLSTFYRLFPTATACWFWQNIFLQLSDKNIFDDLIENFLVFRPVFPWGWLVSLLHKPKSSVTALFMVICIVLDIKNRRKTLMRRLMQPRPRPAHRVLVSCGELRTHSKKLCTVRISFKYL